MTTWEESCRRCGLCCFEKSVDLKGRFITTKTPCRYLDIISRECRVYDKRFEVGEGCVKLTPEVVRNADWLPEDCAYRAISGRGTEDEERD
jgi:uncharacterized cysteine cluster protein YcgN (CxxCxxCC family)